jgi:hypothetical protein
MRADLVIHSIFSGKYAHAPFPALLLFNLHFSNDRLVSGR